MHETEEQEHVVLQGDARVVGRGRDGATALEEVDVVPHPKSVRPRA